MTNTRETWIPRLLADVQQNCHISDAHHARNYSLCIYLLKMREYYRWEQGFSFQAPLPKDQLGAWLNEREALWEKLESTDFSPLRFSASEEHSPFDSNAINLHLEQAGLVYSGGYVGPKPHFFLAELEHIERHHGTTIYISGHELARELTAPPAMSLGTTIYLRRESLRRMIWEKLEEWGWSDPNRAIARSVAYYDFKRDFDTALDEMTGSELDTLLQHELGEIEIGTELGAQWEEMLSLLPRSRAEYLLRAIRDHWADCQYTLPWLLENGRESSLHFFMANFTTLRREIFPELERAYHRWLDGHGTGELKEVARTGAERWRSEAQQALKHFEQHGGDAQTLLDYFSDREVTSV